MEKILDSVWFTGGPHGMVVGMVSFQPEVGAKKVYIGHGLGFCREHDERAIIRYGVPVGIDGVIEFLKKAKGG